MKTKTYDVQIEATVIKTIRVNAIDEGAAEDLAHQLFSVRCDEHEEYYEQNTRNVWEEEREDA